MMTATDELINDYLDRLGTAARGLPATRRVELLAEITEHITVALAESPGQDEATVRTVLDRLGAPEDIAREAGALPADPPARPAAPARIGGYEIVTVLLLLIGGIVLPVFGWIVGVVLLWGSARWTPRDKLLGTFVFPGGLAVLAWFLLFWSGTSPGLAATIALVGAVGSAITAGHLLSRAWVRS